MARKEQERLANAGLFLWGIGNAIGPSMLQLLVRTNSPEAVFSPIRSRPRREDIMPSCVVAWTEAQTLSGDGYGLPKHSLITSRYDLMQRRTKHYALVCYSATPIALGPTLERVQFAAMRNLVTSRPVGASQVTAVVHVDRTALEEKSLSYDVAFRARLTPPYFVLLRAPVPLANSGDRASWSEVVNRMWSQKRASDTTKLAEDSRRHGRRQ